jgi:hypothetical protein
VPRAINSIVVGTREPGSINAFRANVTALSKPELVQVASTVADRICEYLPAGESPSEGSIPCAFAKGDAPPVFTDDLAPVEQVVDQILLGYIRENG